MLGQEGAMDEYGNQLVGGAGACVEPALNVCRPGKQIRNTSQPCDLQDNAHALVC